MGHQIALSIRLLPSALANHQRTVCSLSRHDVLAKTCDVVDRNKMIAFMKWMSDEGPLVNTTV